MKKPVTDVRINQMYFKVLPCASKDGDYWDIVNKGKWEPETFDFMRNYIRPDKDYIEIGGWIGSTAMAAYAYNPRQVYTIEADPANYQTLKMNIYNNHLQDKIKMFNACLTDTENSGKIIPFGTADKEKPNSSSHRLDNGSRIMIKTTNALPFIKKNCDIKNINTMNIDIESSEIYMKDVFKYFEDKNIAILLSLHNPFWQDKIKSANYIYSYIKGYTILDPFTYNEITKPQIKDKLLENKFYSIILEGRGR